MILSLFVLTLFTTKVQEAPTRVPTLKRLEKPFLEQTREQVKKYAAERKPVELKTGLQDWRCVLHCHSYLSHDSRGKIEEIAAAAKQVGVQAIFMTDHPQQTRDVVSDGKSGIVDGVLFVPGSETNGYLVYPGDRKLPDLKGGAQSLADALRPNGGMLFVAHAEGEHDWKITGMTGMEIYNTHRDVMDEKELLGTLRPKDSFGYLKLFGLLELIKQYPQELFASLFDAPLDFLARYDQMAKERPFTAIAANDSHQNQGFIAYGTDDGKYRLTDPLGEQIAILDPVKVPILKTVFGEPVAGKELFRRILDTYPASLGYVNTHVLAPERTEAALRKSLGEARTYVAFDWMADATGTAFVLRSGGKTYTIGDSIALAPGMTLEAEVPLAGSLRIVCDGKEVASAMGRKIRFEVKSAGVYRFEASLQMPGEMRPWVYTGAIRVL